MANRDGNTLQTYTININSAKNFSAIGNNLFLRALPCFIFFQFQKLNNRFDQQDLFSF